MTRVGSTPGGSINPNTSDGIVVSDAAGNDRVLVGLINPTTQDYGIKIVSSDGTTVIIDGSSNVFKIIANGTMSLTEATGAAQATTSVTLTALGTFSTIPANTTFLSLGNTVSDTRTTAVGLTGNTSNFVANVSGGSPTTRIFSPLAYYRAYTNLDGSNFCVLGFALNNATGASLTVYLRYYVLQETAL